MGLNGDDKASIGYDAHGNDPIRYHLPLVLERVWNFAEPRFFANIGNQKWCESLEGRM